MKTAQAFQIAFYADILNYDELISKAGKMAATVTNGLWIRVYYFEDGSRIEDDMEGTRFNFIG